MATAVDWFIENLPNRFKNAILNECGEEIKKAKAMEKQQMNNAWDSGIDAYLNNEDLIEAWAGFKKYYKSKQTNK